MSDFSPNLSWVVAYFPKSNEYGVLPMNWLFEEKGNENGLYCLWPPGKNITSEIAIRADPPNSSWLTFQVKIIINKLFDDYVQAWHHLVILAESPLVETPLILPNNVKNYNLSKPKNVNVPIDACSSSQLSENINLPNDGMTADQETIIMNTPKSTDNQNDDSTNFNNLDIKNLLYGIFNGGINLKFMLSQVLSKLENLQKLFAKMKLPSTKILDAQFLEKFPINSSDALKCIEECIMLDEFDFGYKLEIYIKTIGGRSFKHHLRRALSRLITDECATKCTWTGRGKGKLTNIRDTCLIKILKRVLQECYAPQINTDFEYEQTVAGWLKYRVLRYNKSKSQKLKT
ncbi:hypothetical protein QTP88_019501 [Uroleucon formosanum]